VHKIDVTEFFATVCTKVYKLVRKVIPVGFSFVLSQYTLTGTAVLVTEDKPQVFYNVTEIQLQPAQHCMASLSPSQRSFSVSGSVMIRVCLMNSLHLYSSIFYKYVSSVTSSFSL